MAVWGEGLFGRFKGEEKNQKVGGVWPGKEEEVGGGRKKKIKTQQGLAAGG